MRAVLQLLCSLAIFTCAASVAATEHLKSAHSNDLIEWMRHQGKIKKGTKIKDGPIGLADRERPGASMSHPAQLNASRSCEGGCSCEPTLDAIVPTAYPFKDTATLEYNLRSMITNIPEVSPPLSISESEWSTRAVQMRSPFS